MALFACGALAGVALAGAVGDGPGGATDHTMPTGPGATVALTTAVPPATAVAPASGPATTAAATTTPVPSSADPGTLVADFTWSPQAPAAGESIRLLDRSSGPVGWWQWRWNGNTVVTSRANGGLSTNFDRATAVTLTVCRDANRVDCATATKVVDVH